jgi:hypothetical protein
MASVSRSVMRWIKVKDTSVAFAGGLQRKISWQLITTTNSQNSKSNPSSEESTGMRQSTNFLLSGRKIKYVRRQSRPRSFLCLDGVSEGYCVGPVTPE